jgi:hypothetical protein
VSRLGAAALHRLAAAAPPGALEMQRELLLARARRLVVGCEGGVWGSAMPAAVAVVLVSGRREMTRARTGRARRPFDVTRNALMCHSVDFAASGGDSGPGCATRRFVTALAWHCLRGL